VRGSGAVATFACIAALAPAGLAFASSVPTVLGVVTVAASAGNVDSAITVTAAQRRVGAGDWFVVGSNFDGVASSSGSLQLRFNDSDTANNSGTYEVTVRAYPLTPTVPG
jgi:hypothetical protein